MDNIIIGHRKAISNVFRQFKTMIDPTERMYMIEQGLFGIFRWGKYKALPKIDYALIFRSHFAKCEACAFDAEEDNPNAYYQVSLVHHSNRRIVVHETKRKKEAFEFATRLANVFNIRLRDAATDPRHGIWLKSPVLTA
jgi:hypothetical protein